MSRWVAIIAAAVTGFVVAALAIAALGVLIFFASMAPGMPSSESADWIVTAFFIVLFVGAFTVVFREMLGKFTR